MVPFFQPSVKTSIPLDEVMRFPMDRSGRNFWESSSITCLNIRSHIVALKQSSGLNMFNTKRHSLLCKQILISHDIGKKAVGLHVWACKLYGSLGLNMGLVSDHVIPYKSKTSTAIQKFITTSHQKRRGVFTWEGWLEVEMRACLTRG